MSVIGILASLLIPAVRSAKCKADSARCISNLRQLGIAVRHYADENEGRLPRAIEFAQARINGAGTLRVTRDPNRPDFKLPELTLPADIPYERLLHHRSMQKLIDQQSRLLSHSAQARGMDAYYERALAMLESPKLRQAFDLAAEHQDPVRPEDLAATIYYLLGIDPHTEI